MVPNSKPRRVRWTTVCIDCADAEEMAAFYGKLFGWEITAGGGEWILMRDPAGGVGLSFQAEKWYEPPVWPEDPGAQTKMLHLEIMVEEGQMEEAVAEVIAAGGRVAPHQPPDRDPSELRVMLDPSGHPFCLFVA